MTDYITDAQNDIEAYFESHEIPKYFYQCLFGELVKIFGEHLIIPDENYLAEYDDEGNIIPSDENEYSYKDQLGYFLTYESGTAGWHMAFKEACIQCDLMNIYQDYADFDWVRSDTFDGYIADRMLEALFTKDKEWDYYFYKIHKENTK